MKKTLLLSVCFTLLSFLINAQQVVPVTGFGNNGIFTRSSNLPNAEIVHQLIQTDGKVLYAVHITDEYGYNSEEDLTRVTAAGVIDATFGYNGRLQMGKGKPVGDLIFGGYFDIQPDGKIVSANIAKSSDGFSPDVLIVERYLSNGSYDSTFGKNGSKTLYAASSFGGTLTVTDIKVKANGKLLVAGIFNVVIQKQAFKSSLIQLNANGNVDSNFAASTLGSYEVRTKLLPLPDNKFIAAKVFSVTKKSIYSNSLVAYRENGIIDSSKGVNGIILNNNTTDDIVEPGIALQADNKTLEYINNNSNSVLLRYNANGSVDGSFGNNGRVITSPPLFDEHHLVSVQSNKKIVVRSGSRLKRYLPDGTPDLSFGVNGVLDESDLDISMGFCLNAKNLYVTGTKYVDGDNPLVEIKAYNLCDACASANIASSNENVNAAAISSVNIRVFPNPVKDQLQISGLSANVASQLQLTDASGRIIKSASTQNATYQWNLQGLHAGVYYVKVNIEGNPSYSFKVIKQ